MPASSPPPFPAPSSDGLTIEWSTWDGDHSEVLTLRWQNEAWTAEGVVGRERVHYVLRLSPLFEIRQMLLFRDLDEPDLWLATDGNGRWGEVNGAHRVDLDGCTDVLLDCTPFTHGVIARRLPLHDGHSARLTLARVDVDTLGVVPISVVYTRHDGEHWSWCAPGEEPVDFTVDRLGFVVDEAGRYRRLTRPDSQERNSAP